VTEVDPDRSLFADGGELGRAMAEKDWSTTPLGTPDGWPVSLRNVVRILLTSRFSMWAAWGPELTTFYNDAYWRDTLQAKHPWALGRPAREMWAEIWPDIGPRIRSVLETGRATWDEDLLLFLERSGYPEETYHTFSYSPLADDLGRTEGMLCVVTETTERVLGERRMACLGDLAAAVATTRTEPDVFTAVSRQLGRNLHDLPFSLTYLFDADGAARLGAAAGVEPGSSAAPLVLREEDDPVWPLARIRAGEQVLIDDLPDLLTDLPTGAWAVPPAQAVAVPIASSAQGPTSVTGFLVVGLNPHRRYDESYRGFVELVANQIASGLLNAHSYEAERRRAESLAELDRAKTDFFSNVSHEFRTPLTLIMGPVAELLSSPALQADALVREELEVIERNALRLGKLVNTLLDFSRIQAGRIDARFEPVDLAATTAELASVFRSAVERAGLTYTVDCAPLGVPVHIDREMWEKVVLNLLSNALKFTFTGGIEVRLERREGVARLTVRDTGIGIPAEELPRLFERFHRVADARGRSGEGSGIGLAMVRELVALHGGTIDVESAPEVGTTFTIDLPLGAGHLPADRVSAPVEPAVSTGPSGASPYVAEALRWLPAEEATSPPVSELVPAQRRSGGRVLVADDNADMRDYLLRLLSPHYLVHAVRDGREALEAALADPPDLVVTDVMMPGMDGGQLLAALRADDRTSRVPVVMLSARAGQQAAVEGLAAGADDYLVKPFSAQELLARVGAHLHLGRARRAAESRFTAMADLAPALIWVADREGGRIFVNRGWAQFTGRPTAEELGQGWRDRLHPEDRDRYASVVTEATADRRGWEVEFRLRRSDGAYHWLLERAVPIGSGQDFSGYVGSCTDINARYRETERQTLLAVVGAALDRETDVDEQLSALARLAVESRLADVCTVRLVGDDGRMRFAGVAGLDPDTEKAVTGLGPDIGLGIEVLETRRTVLTPELPTAGTDEETTKRRLGLQSAMAVPLTVRGRVLAVLGLGRRGDAPPFNEDDRDLAEEIAARAALSLDNAVLIAEERGAAHRLSLLQRATAELSAATTPVKVAVAAAGHIRQLTGQDSRVAVYELDPAHRSLSALTISGGTAEAQRVWSSLPLSAPLAVTTAVTERRALWIEEVSTGSDPDRMLPPELLRGLEAYGLAATVALPLIVAGRVVGVIGIGFAAPQRFSPTDRAMLLAVAEQCAQALDRARLYRAERGIAETLQRSLLPARLPALGRLALAAHYLPGAEGTQAGGDWYDVVELGDSRVAIAVGDVVGQGPAAAAVMGQLRSALSTALLQGCSPAESLELLDRFAARLPGALASTAACLVIDATEGWVCWARAGHPPPLLLRPDGSARLLEGDPGSGAVLGAPGREPYTEATADISPGATLVLYTDGLIERRGELLDDGLRRIRQAAARHAAADPARLTRRLLTEALADADQPDDVAVIAARLLPGPLQQRLPADPAQLAGVRRRVAAWAVATGLPEDVIDDLQLALGEALANSVEHAYAARGAGECAFEVARQPDGEVRVLVRDEGAWRPPPADRGFRGRGLELISALAEDVEVTHGPGPGTTVSFRLTPVDEAGGVPVPAPRRPVGAEGATGGAAEPGTARLAAFAGSDGLRLEVTGELDLATAGAVREGLLTRLGELRAGDSVVLDLRPTSYLASAGLGMVLQLRADAEARGIDLRVCAEPGTAPARILALAGLDEAGERTGAPPSR
jgi:anti-anti-sigma factor